MVVCLPKNNHCQCVFLYFVFSPPLLPLISLIFLVDFFQCFRSVVMKFSVLDVSSKTSKTTCYVHNCSKLENSS